MIREVLAHLVLIFIIFALIAVILDPQSLILRALVSAILGVSEIVMGITVINIARNGGRLTTTELEKKESKLLEEVEKRLREEICNKT